MFKHRRKCRERARAGVRDCWGESKLNALAAAEAMAEERGEPKGEHNGSSNG